jgi:CHAD domain-containing protein
MPSADRKHLAPVLRSWGHGPLDPLPLALEGREDGIHDVRVAARRLRVALPLLTRKPERPRVRDGIRLLRRLGDLAGPTRDLDVIGGLLAAHPSDEPEGALLLPRLFVQRERAWHTLRNGLSRLDLSAVQGRIAGLAAEEPEPLFVVMSRLARQRDELARDIQTRLRRSWRFQPDALHRLRIRVRRLRYVAEIYGEIRRLPGPAERLKSLQDVLGEIQDAWVVRRWLRREASLAHRRRHASFEQVSRGEAERWTERARQSHRQFLAVDADAVVRAVVRTLGSEHPPAARRAVSALLP